MCCCPKPSINGEPNAYSWDGKSLSTRPANPPALSEGDVLVYDEPGRCGGLDCHSHHFRLVRNGGMYRLLVRHGGRDDERVEIPRFAVEPLAPLDTNARYWLLHALYSVQRDSADRASDKTRGRWMQAFLEKRIKARRKNGRRWAEIVQPATP
jgi:hypothetical protein